MKGYRMRVFPKLRKKWGEGSLQYSELPRQAILQLSMKCGCTWVLRRAKISDWPKEEKRYFQEFQGYRWRVEGFCGQNKPVLIELSGATGASSMILTGTLFSKGMIEFSLDERDLPRLLEGHYALGRFGVEATVSSLQVFMPIPRRVLAKK